MALLGNYSVLNKVPVTYLAGTSCCDRSNWNPPGPSRNMFLNDESNMNVNGGTLSTHFLFTYGVPLGGVPPYSWIIPQVAGGMAMRGVGSSLVTYNLIPQQPTSAAFTGSSTFVASLNALGNIILAATGGSSFVASMTGTGSMTIALTGSCITSLTISANGSIVLTLSGSSTIVSSLTGNGNINAGLTGSGTISATAALLIEMIAALTGSSTVTANISGNGIISIGLTGSGSINATLAYLVGMLCAMTGSSSFSANATLLTNLICNMTGSGTLNADAVMLLFMLTNLTGSGTITASMIGQKPMSASMTGLGSLSANINGVLDMVANLIGSGNLSGGVGAIADMNIDITVTGTGLTTANVGAAIWDALASEFNKPGTMGNKLNSAGNAGDPWGTILPAGYTGEQAGNILAQIQLLVDELHKIQGLDPANPSTTDINTRKWTAGNIVIDMSGDLTDVTTMTREP